MFLLLCSRRRCLLEMSLQRVSDSAVCMLLEVFQIQLLPLFTSKLRNKAKQQCVFDLSSKRPLLLQMYMVRDFSCTAGSLMTVLCYWRCF